MTGDKLSVPLAVLAADSLPSLIDWSSQALAEARSSAEVLESRDLARLAYDAARSASRMARTMKAHDALIADLDRARVLALQIEAGANMRLADEYDAAQDRSEVGQQGSHRDIGPDGNEVAPDPERDAVLSFIDLCEQLALTPDLAAVAAYDDPALQDTRRRMLKQADAALAILQAFRELIDDA